MYYSNLICMFVQARNSRAVMKEIAPYHQETLLQAFVHTGDLPRFIVVSGFFHIEDGAFALCLLHNAETYVGHSFVKHLRRLSYNYLTLFVHLFCIVVSSMFTDVYIIGCINGRGGMIIVLPLGMGMVAPYSMMAPILTISSPLG